MNMAMLNLKKGAYNFNALKPDEQLNALLWVLLILGALTYTIIHVNYNIYYVDDAWMISNVWNMTKLGVAKDLVFIEPDGKGYAQYFGITYAFVMGHLLNLLGWTKSNVFFVNSIIVWLTALVWYFILKQLPFSKSVAKLTVAFLPLFPPFYFAAHSGRADAMAVLIISAQLLLFVRKRYFLAAFLTGIAFETHVMGVVGLFFMSAYTIYKWKEISEKKEFRSMAGRFLLGGAAAAAYYLVLHMGHFSITELTSLVNGKKDMASPLNNYILTYFSDFDFYVHIWEFALLITGVVLYFKKGLFRKNRFLTILLLVLFISTLITRRENRNYLVYIFPAFILLYFYTFEQLKRLKKFTVFLTLVLGVYYGLHYYANSYYKFEKIVLETKEGLKQKSFPVIGMPDFWFAAMDRDFIPIHSSRDFNRLSLDKFYLIQSDYLEYRNRIYGYTMQYFMKNYKSTLVKEIPIFENKKVQIWECEKINPAVPKLVKQEYPGWREVAKNIMKGLTESL